MAQTLIASRGNQVKIIDDDCRPTWAELPIRDQRFCAAYLDIGKDTYLNATKSYHYAHPNCQLSTANVNGCKKLQELRPYLGESLPSKEWVVDALKLVFAKAIENNDLVRVESVSMNLAKLSGYLVDRVEVRDVTDDIDDIKLVEELRKRAVIT